MQSPSNNIMNKLARSILSLYSYSDVTENTTIEDEMSIALDLIAKMPILMDGAYQAKRHKYDNASLIMHPLRPEENTGRIHPVSDSERPFLHQGRGTAAGYPAGAPRGPRRRKQLHLCLPCGDLFRHRSLCGIYFRHQLPQGTPSRRRKHQGHPDAGRHQGARGTLGKRG